MQKGDILIYFSNDMPKIGKFVNYTANGKIIIIGKNQNRKIRKKEQVLSLNELAEKYKLFIGRR